MTVKLVSFFAAVTAFIKVSLAAEDCMIGWPAVLGSKS